MEDNKMNNKGKEIDISNLIKQDNKNDISCKLYSIDSLSNLKVSSNIQHVFKSFGESAKYMTKLNITALNPINFMNESIKNSMESYRFITTNVNEMLNNIVEKMLEPINNQAKIMQQMVGNILKDVDFQDFWLKLYGIEFIEHEDIVEVFMDKTIFPPIRYLCKNEYKEIEKVIENNEDIEKWILNNEIKIFYLKRIESWKNKFSNDTVKKILDEVHNNIKNGNYISAYLVLNTVIEYMLNEHITNPNRNRYKKLRTILSEEVFLPINRDDMCDKFINNNLYCDTRKAEEFSRHTVHGDRLELITPKVTMSMIFLFDFLQEVISVSEDR